MTTQKHGPQKQGRENYQRLAERCRQAARTASTENERTELMARAETFDFLADSPAASSWRASMNY